MSIYGALDTVPECRTQLPLKVTRTYIYTQG